MSVCNLCWASKVFTGAKWPTQPELIMVSKAWANQEYHCSSPGLEAGPLQGLTPSISPGFPYNLPVPTYILGWAEALWGEGFWSRTQHTDQVISLKCGPLNPKSKATASPLFNLRKRALITKTNLGGTLTPLSSCKRLSAYLKK